jgi:hypothetical protein
MNMHALKRSALKTRWITALSVLAAGFLVFISVAALSTSDPGYEISDRILGAVTALGALALLGGLWSLRTERLRRWAANALIIPALILVGSFFWSPASREAESQLSIGG